MRKLTTTVHGRDVAGRLDPAWLEEFAAQIRAIGVPVVVRP
jgi:hypothetical protein